jgi:hypothetical protein
VFDWGTSYYEVYYEDGSYFRSTHNEDEGWSEYYSEDADGIWMSEYSDEYYWSMSTYDPYTGRNVYQSGDAEGNFWMSVEEEDGTWSEEYHGADGSMELTRYENDGSMTKEVIEADGTSYNVVTDWEGNESYERRRRMV